MARGGGAGVASGLPAQPSSLQRQVERLPKRGSPQRRHRAGAIRAPEPSLVPLSPLGGVGTVLPVSVEQPRRTHPPDVAPQGGAMTHG